MQQQLAAADTSDSHVSSIVSKQQRDIEYAASIMALWDQSGGEPSAFKMMQEYVQENETFNIDSLDIIAITLVHKKNYSNTKMQGIAEKLHQLIVGIIKKHIANGHTPVDQIKDLLQSSNKDMIKSGIILAQLHVLKNRTDILGNDFIVNLIPRTSYNCGWDWDEKLVKERDRLFEKIAAVKMVKRSSLCVLL